MHQNRVELRKSTIIIITPRSISLFRIRFFDSFLRVHLPKSAPIYECVYSLLPMRIGTLRYFEIHLYFTCCGRQARTRQVHLHTSYGSNYTGTWYTSFAFLLKCLLSYTQVLLTRPLLTKYNEKYIYYVPTIYKDPSRL